MKFFAIGDLHLSSSVDKPMDIFGDNWQNHDEKIFKYWKENVTEEDIVFVVGDISWGSKLMDAKSDLDNIANLPGKKYFIRGNHDYWWTTATALNKLYSEDDNMNFMNTELVQIGDYCVCGTRGWSSPYDERFEEKDEVIYKREANRLKLSLENARKKCFDNIIVLLHYPPTNSEYYRTLFIDVIEEYKPKCVIYGHLHGKDNFDIKIEGEIDGVRYYLVSADYVDFKLKEIDCSCNDNK